MRLKVFIRSEYSSLFGFLNSFALKAMYSSTWTLGLNALGVASLGLKPHELLDLPSNTSYFDIVSNNSSPRNDSVLSIFSVNSLPSTNSNQLNSGLDIGRYECDRIRCGQPSIDSCRDAYSWMGSSRETLNYKDRSAPGIIDVVLPLRYSSSTWPSL